MRTAKDKLFRDRRTAPGHPRELPHSVEIEVTVSAKADAGRVRITAVLPNGFESEPSI
jgi:hypothetical protein